MKKIAVLTVLSLILFSYTCFGASWFVDKAATGTNSGTSWSNAWQSFTNIIWSSVKPGDSIFISGGPVSKTYSGVLNVGSSGTSGSPITISVGQDVGHRGLVIIDAGFISTVAININGRNYINVTGKVGSNPDCMFRVTRGTTAGIEIGGNSTNCSISYVDIQNNGNTANSHGITLRVPFVPFLGSEIHHCTIHDNYADGINALQTAAGEATQFGSLKIYENDIYNFVDDGIEISLGADIYNNKIRNRILGAGVGHPDGIQFYNSYTRIYNNDFYDIVRTDDASANSAIFSDAFDPDITNNPKFIYIYNNRITETKTPYPGEFYRGIAIKLAEAGVTGGHDIIVANNTMVGIPFYGLSFTTNNVSSSAVYNIIIENNILLNCARSGIGYVVMAFDKGDGTITYGSHGSGRSVIVDYNCIFATSSVFLTNLQLGGVNYSYTQFKSASGCEVNGLFVNPSLDVAYKPDRATAPVVGAGCRLDAFFTTDKDGIARPAGSWDVGAYQYSTSGTSAPAAPTNLRLK